jgi:Predicted acyltransferases
MKRISQLDGVRGIAILLVIVWHYFTCQIVAPPRSVLFYCSRLTNFGWSGVDLFFVLSGFLIASILLDHRYASNYFRVFYLRRVCRILPIYFLLLALFVVVSASSIGASPSFRWLLGHPLPTWSYATFTQNILMGIRGDFGPNWLGITWSLAVEEQFYVFVPLLIYFLPRRILLLVFIIAVLTAPILRYMSPGFHGFVNTPWQSDSLFSGAALAVLVRWHPFVTGIRQHRRFLRALFLAILGVAAVLTIRATPFAQAMEKFWLAGLYAIFILVAFVGTEPWLGRLLRFSVLVRFGQLSYGIYLFHETVSGVLHGMLRHSKPQIRTISDAAVTVLALCVTMLLAAMSYRFFEQPILRFGHRFQYSPRAKKEISLETAPSEPSRHGAAEVPLRPALNIDVS